MHHVSHDKDFLVKTLAGVAAVDPFIKNLLDIYVQVDIDAQWELDFIRSDYLLHCDDPTLTFRDALDVATYKQVEVNMICIAFAGTEATVSSRSVARLIWFGLVRYIVRSTASLSPIACTHCLRGASLRLRSALALFRLFFFREESFHYQTHIFC